MASIASRAFVLAVLLVLYVAPAVGQAAQRQCGYDRWPVKILSDKDRQRVNFTPVETTIAKLTAIPIHEIPYPRDKRIEPEELKTFKVRGKLIEVRPEQDSDLHLIIADLDKPDIRMIAEIPAPQCAEGTGHEEDYRKAREALQSIALGSVVEITGVGFFDFIHNATGTAKNGIELHPVLKLSAVKP
jgi:hypothetical protein